MKKSRVITLQYFMYWSILFVLGVVLSQKNMFAIRFFSISIGLTSLITLLLFFWSGTGQMSNTSTSITVSMAAYAIKLILCSVIFIYFFNFHSLNKKSDLLIGALVFTAFTVLEVMYALKLISINKGN